MQSTALRSVLRPLAMAVHQQASRQTSVAAAKGPSRRMVYPYTLTAKLAQFPYKFMFKNSWVYRYLIPSNIVVFYVLWKITKLVNSPEAVKLHEERMRREAEQEGHH